MGSSISVGLAADESRLERGMTPSMIVTEIVTVTVIESLFVTGSVNLLVVGTNERIGITIVLVWTDSIGMEEMEG